MLIQNYYSRPILLFISFILSLTLSSCASLLAPDVTVDIAKLRAGQYSLDKTHASLLFKVQHLGLSTYVGRFNDFDGGLDFDPADIVNARLEAQIDIDSLDINNPGLKDDLMDATWFDQSQFPKAQFTTASVIPVSASEFEFIGKLNWRGITKPVSLVVTFHGGANNLLTGKYTLGFSAQGSLLRSDFGMDAYIPIVGDEINIEIYAEFQRD